MWRVCNILDIAQKGELRLSLTTLQPGSQNLASVHQAQGTDWIQDQLLTEYLYLCSWTLCYTKTQHLKPIQCLNKITYSMVQSPSSETNWFAASQEIPRILWNPKVHYRTHKHPPPVPILGQPNAVHIPTSHLLKIHSNIIHQSTPRSP